MSSQLYKEKLQDPRWQRKRLEILTRDNFTCQICKDTEKNLQIHHRHYVNGRLPWDYPNELLVTLCNICHKKEEDLCFKAADAVNTLHNFGYFNFEIVAEINKLIEKRLPNV